MSFYVGQKVVYIGTGNWSGGMTNAPGPSKNEVVTFDGYDPKRPDFIRLVEYAAIAPDGIRYSYRSYNFRPLDALTEQMDRIEAEGAPVEQPEPAFA